MTCWLTPAREQSHQARTHSAASGNANHAHRDVNARPLALNEGVWPPTVRQVTGWLTRRPQSLTEDEHPQLKALLDRCPELQAASSHIRLQ